MTLISTITDSLKRLTPSKIKDEIDNRMSNKPKQRDRLEDYMIAKTVEFKYYHKDYQLLTKCFYNATMALSPYGFVSKIYRHYVTVLYVLNKELPKWIELNNSVFSDFSTFLGNKIPDILTTYNENIQLMLAFINDYHDRRHDLFVDTTFKKSTYDDQLQTAAVVEELLAIKNGLFKSEN